MRLTNTQLSDLDNLPNGIGNFQFDGDGSVVDSLDIIDGEAQQDRIFNRNTVTFLNELDNDISGFNDSDDVINGQGGSDRLCGLRGDDLLRGGAGNDALNGSRGADTLVGNTGDDLLNVGMDDAVDTVVYRAGDGRDRILNFNLGTDLLRLEGIDAIDIVERNGHTFLLQRDGIANNPGFGTGQTLIPLERLTGLNPDNVGQVLHPSSTTKILFV